MLDQKSVASRIKVLRGTLSQRAFAERLKCGQTYVSEIETGKTKPSIEFLVALSEEFEASIDFVLRGGKLEKIHSPEKIVVRTFIRSLQKIQEEVIKAGEQLQTKAI